MLDDDMLRPKQPMTIACSRRSCVSCTGSKHTHLGRATTSPGLRHLFGDTLGKARQQSFASQRPMDVALSCGLSKAVCLVQAGINAIKASKSPMA